jgi:hypothetical protein
MKPMLGSSTVLMYKEFENSVHGLRFGLYVIKQDTGTPHAVHSKRYRLSRLANSAL